MRLGVACGLALALCGVADAQTRRSPAALTTIGTIDSIYSPTLKEYRRVAIYTPPSYRQAIYAPHAYPVLYLLDGEAHFHSVSGLAQILGTGVNGTYVIPEMIVVAIPNTDRTRDLTPTHSLLATDTVEVPAFASSGGGRNFLNFIKTELIPHIDSAYRTERYRLLVGHSLGGLTVIDALYTMPETFNAYIAIDPSLWWDNQVLLKKAQAYFSKSAPPARALYVAQANTKDPFDTKQDIHFNSITAFNHLLETGNRSGIRYAFKYYGDDSHGSVPMIAEYDALRFIFSGYGLNIDSAMHRPALVRERFAQMSAKLGYRALPPEKMIELFGQAALATDTAKALAFMQMNVDLYPKSANAFAELGVTQLARADTAKARAALEHALELAPGDEPIRRKLQSIAGKR
ncbi:MAG: alpha/beta hydrolase-fold protein [Gemmatimonadaceae bacterium]